MTTTQLFSGMDVDAKSSSRVLAPPGGGSSNIFGHMQEDTKPAKASKPSDSDVLNQSEAPQPVAASPAHKDIRSRNQRQGPISSTAYNPITGEPIEDPKKREEEEEAEKKAASDSYKDHLAGQPQSSVAAAAAAAPAPAEPSGEFRSTRVSQPPGGRSTKLWWAALQTTGDISATFSV